MSKNIAHRVLALLDEHPGLRSIAIADQIGADRKDVNDALHGELSGQVRQDAKYNWHALKKYVAVQSVRPVPATSVDSKNILAKLCRYYLDSLAQSNENGVSVFAASERAKNYLELSHLPGAEQADVNPFDVEGIEKLLRSVKQSKGRQVLHLGYPCRLRKH